MSISAMPFYAQSHVKAAIASVFKRVLFVMDIEWITYRGSERSGRR